MGIYDLLDDKEVYACPLTINTGRQANDTVQIFSFINDQIKAELSKHTPEKRQAFEDVVKNVSNYFAGGIVALWMQAARDKGRKLTSADIKEICAKLDSTLIRK